MLRGNGGHFFKNLTVRNDKNRFFVQKGKRYDGYALGAGLTFGYVFALTNNLNVDLHAGFGLVRTSYTKTYLDGSPIYVNGTTRPTEAGFVGMRLIPTKIGVSLSYTLW